MVLALHTGSPAPWYTNWNLWLLIIGVLTFLAGVAVWWLSAIGVPRRLITYQVPVSSSLLGKPTSDWGGEIQVVRDGKVLRDPHLLKICVSYRGYRDVRSVDFDREKPLEFDFGAPIVDAVGGADLDDAVDFSDRSLRIRPALLRRGPLANVTFLVEGNPRVMVRNHIADVRVKEQVADERRDRLRSGLYAIGLIVVAVFLLIAAVHH